MNEKFDFKFSVFELNTLIKGLKELPYKESNKLIEHIQIEYEKQAMAMEKARKESKPVKEDSKK